MAEDEVIKEMEKAYKYETDEELDRKRKVFLTHIVAHTKDAITKDAKDTETNREKYLALSNIVRGRVHASRRRELLKELLLRTE